MIAGMALIGLHFHIMIAYYYHDDTMFFADGNQQFAVAHFLLGMGWILWAVGIVLGIKAVILTRSKSSGPFSDCLNYSVGGAGLIAAGWSILGGLFWFGGIIVNFTVMRGIYSCCYFMVGGGFVLMGQGLYSGMREIVLVSRKISEYSYAKRTFVVFVGGMIYGIAMIIIGLIYILQIYSNSLLFALHYLLQGIGLAVFSLGMIIGFRISFKPSRDSTKNPVGNYSLGIVSILILSAAAFLFVFAYFQLSLLWFAMYFDSKKILDLALDDTSEIANKMIMVGYFLMAIAFPIAVIAASSHKANRTDDMKNDFLSMGPGQENDTVLSSIFPTSPPPLTPQQYGQQQPLQQYPPVQPLYQPQQPAQPQYQQQPLPQQPSQQQPRQQFPQQQSTQQAQSQQFRQPLQPQQTKTWLCPKCGNRVEQRFIFCTECGFKRMS